MNVASKRDFGSFHSSNVQELIAASEDQYVPPALNVPVPSFDEYRSAPFQFGKTAREKHFLLDDCVFLNHGAFGAVLRQALDVAQSWQRYIERQPLRFFDRELLPLLVYVTRRLAKFVGCDAADIVLVPNVTTAVNCVLRSQNLKPGDTVFSLSTEYGGVKKMLKQICLESGATWQEETLSLPIESKEQILGLVSRQLKVGTSLMVVDHIPSNTPFVMPLNDLIQIAHTRNVRVLVDGAHALGALDLNLSTIGADYYVSNAHKWFSAPKGAAFMYVNKKHQPTTHPLVISHGYGSGFNSEFIWAGLRDYSPLLALLTVLDFWETVGPETIRTYMYRLAQEAGQMLTRMWSSSLLAPADMFGAMIEVEVPTALYADCGKVDYSEAEALQNVLYHRFNIEVPVKAVGGRLYVRLSAHIYNHLSEYERLGAAVQQLISTGTPPHLHHPPLTTT